VISAPRSPSTHLFRVSSHAGVWCVLRNGAFFADYASQTEAIDAAHAAARKEEAFGHTVQVLTPSDVPQARAEAHRDE
jgi:hypothetical protein